MIDGRYRIGDEVYIHGYIDEIRNGTIIIRNEGGYFGTAESEVYTIDRCDTADRKPTCQNIRQVEDEPQAERPYATCDTCKNKGIDTLCDNCVGDNYEPQTWTKEDCKGCKYNEYPYDGGTCFVRVCINGNKYEPKDEPQTERSMAIGKRSDATADKYNLYGKTTTVEPQTDCAWK